MSFKPIICTLLEIAPWLILGKIEYTFFPTNGYKTRRDQATNNNKREYAAYKYSNKGRGPLYEAVILAGQPVFLTYDNEIKSLKQIEDPWRILRSPTVEEYPYEPYEFFDLHEIE